ncbi:MAG: ABC transporter ATP-binding protein [Pseudorhodoplanes sp.]|uniref:ABC transporter ATP-binding protein n=1 Tax=Pseudorhodoplanes sp. TaxID=1934341 RepID=UPI003D0CEA32
MTTILSARDLEKSFGSFVAAFGISCDVQQGEIVGIIGANGAGKTTFVNMVTGHLVPTQGRIEFNGRDITGMASRKITQLGMGRSFQIAQVFATLTALENMCVATAIARNNTYMPTLLSRRMMAPETVSASRRTLEQFGIAQYADLPANTLSQGVRKILDVAMAAARDPVLIMLDEPTSGVSREERHDLMDHIMIALRQRGVTILFVEHDMEIVASYAQRVLAFIDGTVIADGTPDIVFAREDVRTRITGHVAAGEAAHA